MFSQSRLGPLADLRRQDLDDIAVVQRRVVAGDAVVDLRADHGVADGGMDGVGKVDGRGAGGQGDDLALGREDEDLVVEHVDLERVDIVVGLDVLLVLQQTPAYPLEFLLRARRRACCLYFQCAATPYSAVWCISQVRICTSKGMPCEPMTVVCSDWYMLGFGVEI